MKIRTDFVSNSSSSSFIFVTNGDYDLCSSAEYIETNRVSNYISIHATWSPIIRFVDESEFKNRFFDDLFIEFWDGEITTLPKSAMVLFKDDDTVEQIEDYKYFFNDIEKYIPIFMKFLDENFDYIMGAYVIKYSISDYNEETGEFQDEDEGLDCIPSDALYYTYKNCH